MLNEFAARSVDLFRVSLEDLRQRFPASFTQTGSLRKIGVTHPPALEAIVFFHDQMVDWVNDSTEGDAATRSMAHRPVNRLYFARR